MSQNGGDINLFNVDPQMLGDSAALAANDPSRRSTSIEVPGLVRTVSVDSEAIQAAAIAATTSTTKGQLPTSNIPDRFSSTQQSPHSPSLTSGDRNDPITNTPGANTHTPCQHQSSISSTSSGTVGNAGYGSVSSSIHQQIWRAFHPFPLVVPALKTNLYVSQRDGNILSRDMILKSDTLPASLALVDRARDMTGITSSDPSSVRDEDALAVEYGEHAKLFAVAAAGGSVQSVLLQMRRAGTGLGTSESYRSGSFNTDSRKNSSVSSSSSGKSNAYTDLVRDHPAFKFYESLPRLALPSPPQPTTNHTASQTTSSTYDTPKHPSSSSSLSSTAVGMSPSLLRTASKTHLAPLSLTRAPSSLSLASLTAASLSSSSSQHALSSLATSVPHMPSSTTTYSTLGMLAAASTGAMPGQTIAVWGATNFRQLPFTPVAAVAQPSVSGIRAVLNMVSRTSLAVTQHRGGPIPQTGSLGGTIENSRVKIRWINLREEPVVYLADRPFVLRERLHPVRNMPDFVGISAKRLKTLEAQLRADIIAEASVRDGNILIHDEPEPGEIHPCWASAGIIHRNKVGTSVNYVNQMNGGHLSHSTSSTQSLNRFTDLSVPTAAESTQDRSSAVRSLRYGEHKDSRGNTDATPHTSRGAKGLVAGRTPHTHHHVETTNAMIASDAESTLVLAPEDVFKRFRDIEGYDVTLQRVPISADSAIKEKDFDKLVNAFLQPLMNRKEREQVFYVFNCQLGRGRSTLGMATFLLLQSCIIGFPAGVWPHPPSPDAPQPPPWFRVTAPPTVTSSQTTSSTKLGSSSQQSQSKEPKDNSYGRIEFDTVSRLLRLLKDGHTVQREVDLVVDLCGGVLNLRLDIEFHLRLYEECQSVTERPGRRARVLSRLRRYLSLLSFHQYLRETQQSMIAQLGLVTPATSPAESADMLSRFIPAFFSRLIAYPFSAWMAKRLDIVRLVDAATVNFRAQPLDPSTLTEAERRVASRRGSVLSAHTILKLDVPPTIANVSRHTLISQHLARMGVPAFRTMEEAPFAAVGQPTTDGIVLALQSAIRSSENQANTPPTLWINLREEPVVYIRGNPYALRDESHPLRPLDEFSTGIRPAVAEGLEDRLKADVLTELRDSAQSGGVSTLLVHEETEARTVVTKILNDVKEDDIVTPRQLFEKLDSIGLKVKYYRVPLNSDDTPSSISFDLLLSALDGSLGGPYCERVPDYEMERRARSRRARERKQTLLSGKLPNQGMLATHPLAGPTSNTPAIAPPSANNSNMVGVTSAPTSSNEAIALSSTRYRNGSIALDELEVLDGGEDEDETVLQREESEREPLIIPRVIVNCMKGSRRSTIALIVGCLLLVHNRSLVIQSAETQPTTSMPNDQSNGSSERTDDGRSSPSPSRLITPRLTMPASPVMIPQSPTKAQTLPPLPALSPSSDDAHSSSNVGTGPTSSPPLTPSRPPASPKLGSNANLSQLLSPVSGGDAAQLALFDPIDSVEEPSNASFKFLTPARPKLARKINPVVTPVIINASSAPASTTGQTNFTFVTPGAAGTPTADKDGTATTTAQNSTSGWNLGTISLGDAGLPPLSDQGTTGPSDEPSTQETHVGAACGSQTFDSDAATGAMMAAAAMGESAESLAREQARRGMHRAILQLTRVLREGRTVKEELDVVIDVCGTVHNVRDAVTAAMNEEEAMRDAGSISRAGRYLESYALLICFNAYLRERSYARNRFAIMQRQSLTKERKMLAEEKSTSDSKTDSGVSQSPWSVRIEGEEQPKFEYMTFTAWLSNRPEVANILEHIRMNPQEALTMANFAMDPYGDVYESRRGHVLGRGTILKNDAFAGIVNKGLPPICQGVINFRTLSAAPVAGTGIPTLQGLVDLLSLLTGIPRLEEDDVSPEQIAIALLADAKLHQGKSEYAVCEISNRDRSGNRVMTSCDFYKFPAGGYSRIVWLNLREEPIIYMQGQPYVLRDRDAPYSNIENTGITTKRAEAMEKQLKRDVLAEASRGGYRILLNDEDSSGNLIAEWVSLQNTTDALTVREAFALAIGAVVQRHNEIRLALDKLIRSEPLFCARLSSTAETGREGLESDDELPLMSPEAESNGLDYCPRPHHKSKDDDKTKLINKNDEPTLIGDYYPVAFPQSIAIDYHRTPITDEQAPSPEIVDAIVSHLEAARDTTPGHLLVVVNCQMGRGRTTTGMVISGLWCAVRNRYDGNLDDDDAVASPELLEAVQLKQQSEAPSTTSTTSSTTSSSGSGNDSSSNSSTETAETTPSTPPSTESSVSEAESSDTEAEPSSHVVPTSTLGPRSVSTSMYHFSATRRAELENRHVAALKKGWYSVITALVRVLPDGVRVKVETDKMIDRSSAMQNLREVVYDMQALADKALERKRSYFVKKGQNFLVRYFYLICINAYLRQHVADDFSVPFSQWLRDRKEISNILEAMEFPQPFRLADVE